MEDLNKYHGITATVPGSGSASPNRGFMFTSNFEHSLVLDKGDIPNYSSTFDKDIYRSSNDIIADKDFMILHVVENTLNQKVIICEAMDDGTIFHLEVPVSVATAEAYFGYRMKEKLPLRQGTIIPKGEFVLRSPSYTDDGIQTSGVNAMTMLTTSMASTEDGVEISESFADKLSVHGIEDLIYTFNKDTVLKNLYGDNSNYVPIPKINKSIENGVLLCEVSNSKIIKRSHCMNSVSINDTVLVRNGKVIKYVIKGPVYTKADKHGKFEEIELHNSFLNDIFKKNKKFDRDILSILNTYKDEQLSIETKGYRDALIAVYEDRYNYSEQGIELNGYQLTITIEKHFPVAVGSKISGFYGNKTVIGKITPDEKMPITADGRRIDLINPSASTISRSIPAQLHKAIRYIGYKVAKHIIDKKLNDKDAYYLILEYYKGIDEANGMNHVAFLEKFKKATSEKRVVEEFIEKDTLRKRILVIDKPMQGLNITSMYNIYNRMKKLGVSMDKDDVYLNGEKLLSKYEVIDSYIIRLKQDPATKLSSTAMSKLDSLGIPIRNKDKKKGIISIGTAPQRYGVQETLVLASILEKDTFVNMFKAKRVLKSATSKVMGVFNNTRGFDIKGGVFDEE